MLRSFLQTAKMSFLGKHVLLKSLSFKQDVDLLDTHEYLCIYPTSNSMSLPVLNVVGLVSGYAILATAKAAGADINEADMTCSAGTCV